READPVDEPAREVEVDDEAERERDQVEGGPPGRRGLWVGGRLRDLRRHSSTHRRASGYGWTGRRSARRSWWALSAPRRAGIPDAGTLLLCGWPGPTHASERQAGSLRRGALLARPAAGDPGEAAAGDVIDQALRDAQHGALPQQRER